MLAQHSRAIAKGRLSLCTVSLNATPSRCCLISTPIDVLSNHKTDFVKALQQDTGKPEFEATLEVSLVLQQLRLQYEDTHFEGLTERVAKHKTGGKIFTPYGSALIVGHKSGKLDLSSAAS